MNRRLAEAVIATFQEADEDVHYARLAEFSEGAWSENYSWLDASGLVLYFLKRIQVLHVDDAIPVKVLKRFERNAADNRDRNADIFDEFIKINKAFLEAGLIYVNLKGFTLVPDACSDAALRCQFDLDFCISQTDAHLCEEILEKHGYWLSGVCNNVWEFKAGSGQPPSVRDLYKVKAQRSIEVHFVASMTQGVNSCGAEVLLGTRSRTWNGHKFPVLPEGDKFIALALHLFKHLKSEWTRTSWILEYVSYVEFHVPDNKLWLEVGQRAAENAELRIALGAVTLVARQTFGIATEPFVLTWTVEELPWSVRLWIQRYGKEVVLAKFPGSKLYLLLRRATDQESEARSYIRYRELFPVRRPGTITRPLKGKHRARGPKEYIAEWHYFFFRLSFHITKGLCYLLEVPHWKRCLASQQSS
jgi:Uncharacterised nucleotidyltransferase